jgi:hypothetical protein
MSLLTPCPDLCEYMITKSESLGYESLAGEFDSYYRNNERILVQSTELADFLWTKLQPYFVRRVGSSRF